MTRKPAAPPPPPAFPVALGILPARMVEQLKLLPQLTVQAQARLAGVDDPETFRRFAVNGEALTVRQFFYLDLIAAMPRPTVGEIAARLGVTRPTASAVTTKLEAAGFVAKVPSTTDRRSFHLEPTGRARELLAHHEAAHRAVVFLFARHLEPGEFRELVRLFDKLIHALEQGVAAAPSPAPARSARRDPVDMSKNGKNGRS